MRLLPESQLSRSAKESRYRHNWIVTLLISILVFLIAMIAELMIMLPVELTASSLSRRYSILSGHGFDVLTRIYISSDTSTLTTLFSTLGMIIIPLAYCVLLEKRSVESLGFKDPHALREYLIGLVVGAGMLALSFVICLLTGSITVSYAASGSWWLLVLYFAAFMVQGMSEEVFCRGYLMQSLSVRYHPIVAVVLNSLLFMALHLLNDGISFLALLNLFLFGVFASVYMWKRGSIWGVAAVHSAWNFAQGNIFGIKVSGAPLGPSVLSSEFSKSAQILNGGDFGLEGGLAVTAVLVIGIIIMLLIPLRSSNKA